MPRIACVWIPDLPLVAHLRLDPESADRPLALTDGRTVRSIVTARTPAAAMAGVICGMTATQARAVCETLIVHPMSPNSLVAAIATVADVAATLSSHVEIADELVFMDCDGLTLMWASESELATVLGARVARQGLRAWIGIADSKLGAAVAARESRGVRIVASGDTRTFLASLPLARLDPDPESATTLASWGLRCIGDLAALSAGAVAHRLGRAGARLHRRAQGDDDTPLRCRSIPLTFTEGFVLDYGLDRLEPLLFILRRLLDCLTRRLDLQGLGCGELEIRLELDGGGCDLRTIAAAAPTTDPKTLLTLIRAHLESRPPARPVIEVSIRVAPTRLRPIQLDFLRPRGPAPTALAATIARLAVLCGPDRVGVLKRTDSHRPDAVEVTPFRSEPATKNAGLNRDPALASRQGPSGETVVRMALRAFRPAVLLEVFENRGRLDYVRGRGFGGRVVQVAGPWRVRGEWWTADPYAREYYDVELSDGGVYRIYRDARTYRWLADGVYD